VSDSPPAFRVERLGDHDRSAFSSGDEALDRYFREQACQDARRFATAPFVLVTAENRIAGFYTLSSAVILVGDLPLETVKKLKWPRYPELPATLIGRLARDINFAGQGIGELLLMDALRRPLDLTSLSGSLAVVVDPKNEAARTFYAKYGFLSFHGERKRMYLPMKTVEELFPSE
jgi:ribosomal protein S18 acetylase RimI-like enzyme